MSTCDPFAVNDASAGGVRDQWAMFTMAQLTNRVGEASVAKSHPVNDAVTACPRAEVGDSTCARSRVEAEECGTPPAGSASVHPMAKGFLKPGYRRKMEVAYGVARQPIVRRGKACGGFSRSFFLPGADVPGRPDAADLGSLRDVMTVSRNGVTPGECCARVTVYRRQSAAMHRWEGLREKPMPRGKPGGYADARTDECEYHNRRVTI
jgi:hypothetical protein